jgi:glycosyltransferase involved in cell wall biosynthesis
MRLPDYDCSKVERAEGAVARVLMIGSLKGIASRSGFEYLARELLPRLERRAKEMRRAYEIRVVGHGSLQATTKRELERCPSVKIVGFVDDAAKEFEAADFVLVTIPTRFGFRTRIADSFGYGQCVVAHAANCAGMPEVVDGHNVLAAEDPEALADRFVRAVNDASLRKRLGAAARQTFIECYSVDRATRDLEKILGKAPHRARA